jgi:alkane 1-monooxygenase
MKSLNGRAWQIAAGSYFSFLLFPLFALGLIYRDVLLLLPAALVMIVVPILDLIAGEDTTLDELTLSGPEKWLMEVAPALFVVANSAVIALTAHFFAELSTKEKVFAILSVGMIGSIGITAAHELVHKLHGIPKLFGRLGLMNVCYLHFEIHHIQGHHVKVGTNEDPSTAWMGESLYHFVFRTVPECLKESWGLERRGLNRRGVAILSLSNRMIQFAFMESAYLVSIWYLGAWTGIEFFFLQAAVAVFMLETTSYIEHYGLLRSKRADGKYEPMSPGNSWDCYGRFSNYLVFQLQRHADHHSYPTRPFSGLQTATEAPRLPVGYPLLIGVAMVPPLWRRTMNPRVRVARIKARGTTQFLSLTNT